MAGAHRGTEATVSIKGGVVITPHDTNTIPVCRAIWIGVTGNIKVRHPDGTTPTYSNVPVGWFEVQADMVFSTDTTATTMVAGY